jgi:hypothetical protein
MLLFWIWPIWTTVLILFLVWQIVRYVSKYYRSMQLRIDSANQQLHKEFQVMESERTRIAKDLHDDLGPLLSAVSMRMNCIQPSRDDDHQHVHPMRQYLSDAIERPGIISYNLSPIAIEHKSLQAALQELFYYYWGSTEDLVLAIHTVYKGDRYFCRTTSERWTEMIGQRKPRSEKPTGPAKLSEKEHAIVKLICHQRNTKVITGILDQSPKTIDAYN